MRFYISTRILISFFMFILSGIVMPTDFKGEMKIGLMYTKFGEMDMFRKAMYDKDIIGTSNCGNTYKCPRLSHISQKLLPNPMATAKLVCDELIQNNISVVITSSFIDNDIAAMAVSYTCGSKYIPTIGVSVRDNVFSDKNTHGRFIRTMAPWSDQAKAWIDLLRYFKWSHVIFIHSSDPEGRAVFGKFVAQAEKYDIKIEQILEYHNGFSNYTEDLQKLNMKKSRIFILFATKNDADVIFQDAKRLKFCEKGFAWIVTEQALYSSHAPKGILGLKLSNGSNIEGHVHDAVLIVKKAIKVFCKNIDCSKQISPGTCNDDVTEEWEERSKYFYDVIKQTSLDNSEAETGTVRFNFMGDRINSIYNIVNVQSSLNKSLMHVIVGSHDGSRQAENVIELNHNEIIWFGGTTTKPKGIRITTHLKVVTIKEIPFVYVEDRPLDKCEIVLNKIPCPRNNSGIVTEHCCYGYVIDLLVKLSEETNFTYELHLVHDNSFGSLEVRNSSGKVWNGMTGEIIDGLTDMIVAPLTITPERAEIIDFSKPFKYQGLTILVKKNPRDSSLGSFLQPFRDTLWVLVGLSVHVVALVLYLLDRFSPFGRFKLAKNDASEEDALNLSSAMWFSWGVLLNSGIGEGTPRSFSARVLGMVWAGFAMIIVASYTANLAAFLVLDRPEAPISGIDDARLRNPQEKFLYATVQNSAVAMYFKRQVELSTMSRTMEKQRYSTPEEAIKDVQINELQAFIWDSSRLEFEAAQHCDLVTAGEKFGRSSYGIGLVKDSPWTETISLAILSFHETGYMEQLDGKWILVKDTNCPEKDRSPATLGLTNMAGVFMMVAGGIVIGVFLIFIEMAYKRQKSIKQKELGLAKMAVYRWRRNIQKRKNLRNTDLQDGDIIDTMPVITRLNDRKENNIPTHKRISPLSPSYKRLPIYSSPQKC